MTPDPARVPNVRRVWITAFLLSTCCLVVAAYGFYRLERERLFNDYAEILGAISRLKSSQISEWRSERLTDSEQLGRDRHLVDAATTYLADSRSLTAREDLVERLKLAKMGRLYSSVALFAPDGQLVLSTDDSAAPETPALIQSLRGPLETQGSVLTNLFSTANGDILLDAATKIPDRTGRFAAIIVLRCKVESLLFPLIQEWPTPSRTAETLVVQRDGADVVFLSQLRHRSQAPLAFRVPLTRTELPAVQAALGRQGVYQGTDYRGVRVLSDIRPIPESPWFIVSKIDLNEILGLARYQAGTISAAVALLVLIGGTLTSLAYRRRQAQLLQRLLDAERQQRMLQEEFRVILYSIGDAVVTTDTAGRVQEMNQVAEQLTGWRKAEAQGRPLQEIFQIVNETTRAPVINPVSTVLREGTIIGLANHTLLIGRDGVERPIADSAAPIRRTADGPVCGVVLIFRDQTTERAAFNALSASENVLRESQKVASLGSYVLDIPSGIWKSTAVLDEIFGLDEKSDRSIAGWASIVAPVDRSMMATYFSEEVVGKGKPFDKEYRIIRASDGVERWVKGKGKLEFDAEHRPVRMIGTIQDITPQRKLADELRSSQEQLAAIYNFAPIVMCLLDEQQRIVHSNRAAASLAQSSPDSLIGLRSGNLVGCVYAADSANPCGTGAACVSCPLCSAITDTLGTGENHVGVQNQILVGAPSNPKRLHLIAHTARLEINGAKRVLLCLTDDTARQEAATAMRTMEEKLRQVQKIEAIGQLAGGVAHDFNNILAAILLYIGLLKNEPAITGDIQTSLKELEKSVQRGSALTKQLLAFSRQQTMELRTLNLTEVLENLLKMLQRLLGEHIVLDLLPAENLPPVDADSAMLELVVINLCLNARDAMPDGGKVTVKLELVQVDPTTPGGHAEARFGSFVRLSVCDTGHGMDETTLQKIFEPFFTTKDVGKGTGLGLATVYGIVKQHRGWVEVHSAPGQGSTFDVFLPTSTATTADAQGAANLPLSKGRQESILLVEDEPAVRNGLSTTLRANGYQVTEAANGPDALLKWKTEPGRFGLLFTDMVMPGGMSGLQLADQLRAETKNLRVVVYTGYSQTLAAQSLDSLPTITLLRKPCDPAELLAAVRNTFDNPVKV